jgi:hypothetical protein
LQVSVDVGNTRKLDCGLLIAVVKPLARRRQRAAVHTNVSAAILKGCRPTASSHPQLAIDVLDAFKHERRPIQ